MALNFLASTSMDISGNSIGDPSQKGFCSFNGFATQVFVVQSMLPNTTVSPPRRSHLSDSTEKKTADYWVLIIAANAFFILGDKKCAATRVQDYSIVVWLLPWGFSVLWAALGYMISGYGDIGGCE